MGLHPQSPQSRPGSGSGMTYPNLLQFPQSAPDLPKRLPKAISGNYRELSQQLEVQIKQKKLADETCYPWEIDCDPPRVKGITK
jgi:hypothetical protein